MADAIQGERALSLFQDTYTPQVTVGYVQFGVIGETLGGIGMVAAAQIISIYSFHVLGTVLHSVNHIYLCISFRLCYLQCHPHCVHNIATADGQLLW